MIAKWLYQHESSITICWKADKHCRIKSLLFEEYKGLSVCADLLEKITISRTTINSLFCEILDPVFAIFFTFADTDWKFRQMSETDCLWILAHKFSVFKKDQKKNQGSVLVSNTPMHETLQLLTDLVPSDTSWETILLLTNPRVNFQYQMSQWCAVAASGNPQWCDWWISQYSDLFSSKLTRLACQHGLTDRTGRTRNQMSLLCCNNVICAAVLMMHTNRANVCMIATPVHVCICLCVFVSMWWRVRQTQLQGGERVACPFIVWSVAVATQQEAVRL